MHSEKPVRGPRMVLQRVVGLPGHSAWTRRRYWVTGFLAFFALSAAWALATPLTAVPDEPSHIIKAAATVRGETTGVPVIVDSFVDKIHVRQVFTGFEVPRSYDVLQGMYTCYFGQMDQPASCAPSMKGLPGDAIAGSSAGSNNASYYLAVGWTSLVSHGELGIYLMRLVSAMLCSALLASAIATASEWSRRKSHMLLGIAAAGTPMALFLDGSVNPNAMEVSAAVLLWCAALALLTDPQPELTSRRLARAGIAAVTLVNVRPLGPAWVVGILLIALLAGRPGALPGLVRNRTAWIWTGVVGAATMAAFAWAAHFNTLNTSADQFPNLTFGRAAGYTLARTTPYLNAMIGRFGWLDVEPPQGSRQAWYAVLLFLAVAACWFSRRRELAALLGLAVAIVFIPVVAQGEQARHLGYIWQGRYLLAIAVGLPLLAAAILTSRAPTLNPRTESRFLAVLGGVLAVDSLVVFYAVLRRYAVGVHGPIVSLHPAWSPPGGILGVVGLFTLGLFLAGLLIAIGHAQESPATAPHAVSAPESADSIHTDSIPVARIPGQATEQTVGLTTSLVTVRGRGDWLLGEDAPGTADSSVRQRSHEA